MNATQIAQAYESRKEKFARLESERKAAKWSAFTDLHLHDEPLTDYDVVSYMEDAMRNDAVAEDYGSCFGAFLSPEQWQQLARASVRKDDATVAQLVWEAMDSYARWEIGQMGEGRCVY